MNLVAAYRRMTGKTQSYFADVLGISLNSLLKIFFLKKNYRKLKKIKTDF